MGLDFVELIMAVEEEFEIEISDDDLNKMYDENNDDIPVGVLENYIIEKLSNQSEKGLRKFLDEKCYSPLTSSFPQCDNVEVFLRLRHSLSQSSGIPYRCFSTGMSLDSFFPEVSRRQVWDSFEKDTNLRLPDLENTAAQKIYLTILSIGCLSVLLLALFFIIINLSSPTLLLPSARFWFITISFFVFLFTFLKYSKDRVFGFNRLAVFPKDCSTFRDLIAQAAELNGWRFHYQGDIKQSLKHYTWEKLVEITCDELGVRPEDVLRDTCYVKDLGAGS